MYTHVHFFLYVKIAAAVVEALLSDLQYLYFCTSKASKIVFINFFLYVKIAAAMVEALLSDWQYLYFCTSKAKYACAER